MENMNDCCEVLYLIILLYFLDYIFIYCDEMAGSISDSVTER